MMPAVGKSGPGHVLHELGERDLRVVEHREAGVDDFDEVVRRNVGGHAHRDAGGAVDQQVRERASAEPRARFLTRRSSATKSTVSFSMSASSSSAMRDMRTSV